MYAIIDADGNELGITEELTYVLLQENHCFALASEVDAQGVCHEGTVYHIDGRPKIIRPDGESVSTITLVAFDAAERINATAEEAAEEALTLMGLE
jgi:hypothetical protein